VAEILKNKDHPAFIDALNWATNHGFGKAKESLEVSGGREESVEHVWMVAMAWCPSEGVRSRGPSAATARVPV
jgi:hypothetical protein